MRKFLLLVTAMCLTSIMRAQFSSSDRLYCYEFVESIDNGMKSYSSNFGGSASGCYFILFRNGYMGSYSADKNEVAGHVLKGDATEYYHNWVIRQNNFLDKPPVYNFGFLSSFTYCYRFIKSLSTGSKYTYRQAEPQAIADQVGMFGRPEAGHWDTTNFRDCESCYTFNLDRTELIIWKANNPNKRDYYKLININSLKPNTDFLY